MKKVSGILANRSGSALRPTICRVVDRAAFMGSYGSLASAALAKLADYIKVKLPLTEDHLPFRAYAE